MPPKRRLSGPDLEDSSSLPTQEQPKKRKKVDSAQQIQTIFDFVRKFKKEDGADLCGTMTRLPNKRSDPGYYEIISTPIDIMKIQQKVKTDEYNNVDELKEDFDLLISNTKAYYKKGTAEYRDSMELKDLLAKVVSCVLAGDDPGSCVSGTVDADLGELLEELFSSVMVTTDAQEPDRQLNIAFKLLPSKKRYPEYYDHIAEPIDLKTIAEKIQRNSYPALQELERDLVLLFTNARTFNEPGSQIYKDAGVLLKVVKAKTLECQANLVARQNRGSKSSRRGSRQVHSTAVAKLQYDEDSETEEEDSESEENYKYSQDPFLKLFSAVRNYKTERGVEIAEVFLALPSKRELPDYYQEIQKPICLNAIRKKIRQRGYSGLEQLGEDLDLMFNNCKEYNRQDSKLWKDANKLQKVMKARLEELLSGGDDVSSSSKEPEKVEKEPEKTEKIEKVKVETPGRKQSSPKTGDPAKDGLRKKLRSLFNSIYYWTNSEGIQPIGVFLEKPSEKEYPDYYDIITEPIDMTMIEGRIKNMTYRSEEELLADCKLMFSNCRLYNEEGSSIYEDANLLERVLMTKARDMGLLGVPPGQTNKKAKKIAASLQQKIKSLYETLKDFRDAKGRQLSLIFLKLPSKHEYPDYYDIIKRPLDLEKISAKIRNNTYTTLEDAVADFTLVFDNACKYNEPDSQIYKDSQTLARLAHQTVRHLSEEVEGIPDARTAVTELLNNIYTTMMSAQPDGESERCFADSLAEVPEHDIEESGKKVRALSLEILKRRIDRGLYKRLDTLQRDVFLVLDRARRLSRTDSLVWEDSVELSRRFIRARDSVCEGRLRSPALEYSLSVLEQDITRQRELKLKTEGPEPMEADEGVGMEGESGTSAWSGENEGAMYNVGDFVYVANSEPGGESHIYQVERLFEKDGGKIIWGGQFFRQRETFHVPNRTFFEREVMKGDVKTSIPIAKVLGKCYVMPSKDYSKFKPEGFEEKDIFVCEWRYTSRMRNWKKIKVNGFWEPAPHIKVVLRESPYDPKRVPSVFKDRINRHKEEVEELEQLEKTVPEDIPANIKWEKEGESEGFTYWEQYTIPGPITLKRGDHVYVRGENNRNMLAQIDTMWTAQDNITYFHGPWFVTPTEIPPQPGKSYYKAEAFLSSISDSNPLLSVVGKCLVLGMQDYCTLRPTGHGEQDVFCCESSFDEGKRSMMPLAPQGLKKYQHSKGVVQDEIFLFRRGITPEKDAPVPGAVPVTVNPPISQPQTPARPPNTGSPMLLGEEDSLDAPPSVGSSVESGGQGVQAKPQGAPQESTKKKMDRKKLITAYILFSADVRKVTMEENPGVKFGEISRIVAERWRGMTDADKAVYADRAKKLNEEKEREEARKEAERLRLEAEQERLRKLQPQPPPVQPDSSPVARAADSSSGGQGPREREGPIFHSVPPRPQRLLHSEAYIKYIEGLTKDSKSMCNWDKQLNANSEILRVSDETKLPVSWLAGNTGEHATSLDALWALRDFMLQEALGVVKIV